jgi:hypothetical protein
MGACVVAVGCKIPEPPVHSLEPCHGILLKGRGATTATVTRFRLGRSDPGNRPYDECGPANYASAGKGLCSARLG